MPHKQQAHLFEKLSLEGFQSGLQCAAGAGAYQTGRLTGRFHLAVRARPKPAGKASDRIDICAIDRVVEGAQKAGLEIRRANYGICLHASDGVD